jgi:hypothetical protein
MKGRGGPTFRQPGGSVYSFEFVETQEGKGRATTWG